MDSEDWIKRFAHETTEKVMSDLQAEAVALCQRGGGPFAYLFSLERKADLKKFCKQAKITKEEFSHTIFACEMGLLPWRHKISHRNFVPDHLQPTEDEWNSVGPALTSDDRSVPKALRKIMIQFDERRLLVGHVFYNDDLSRWHLLYFDQRDTSPHRNHWTAGSHLHLINWLLWPGKDANEAWHEFHGGNPSLGGALHIRCAFG
jgi:hypothetical protein